VLIFQNKNRLTSYDLVPKKLKSKNLIWVGWLMDAGFVPHPFFN